MSGGTFTPAPGRAPLRRLLAAQSKMELTLTLRRGESLLLTVVIPVLLLVGAVRLRALELPTTDRAGFVTPGVLALAALSTAFTGQAISTGYERSYGVLKRLGAAPLPRWALLLAKTAAVLVIIAGQAVLLGLVGALLGWRPALAGLPAALALTVLAVAGFSALGLLMAGTLRAEATLAGANLIYLVLLAVSGVVVPVSAGLRAVVQWLPLTALVDGLRAALAADPVPGRVWWVLTAWAALAIAAAARFFRWE
jgi:ABC-2 type transport system permease protein